jgi:two-component system OmpR family response regulator
MSNLLPHLLIVDDDAEIRQLLGQFLQEHGFHVTLAKDGKEMFEVFAEHSFELIILDLMLPGDDGLTLCRKLRTQSNLPIIMLTAAGEEVDRIVGLEIGADDYLSKPFNPRELLARIRAILRRSNSSNSEEATDLLTHDTYQFSGWTLDRTARQLLSPEDIEITLSAGEFELLVVLLEHPQQVLSRDQLLDHTKNREAGPFDRSIDIQVSRIRHKIEEDSKKPTLIKTVRGGGYVLSTAVKHGKKRTG